MQIGWIGTGVMGRSMAGHLLAGGLPVRVFSRTKAKAQALLEQGGTWCETPAEAAVGCDVVFTMVGYPEELRELVLDGGAVLRSMKRGAMLVDCTTSSPSLAREIFDAAQAAGVDALDAPVSGGDVGARNATLSIMVGGEARAFERARPLLELLGKTVVLQGPAGCGQHAKMVNQILIASGMVAVCEGLMYARACGLDPQRVLESVGGGAAASWSLSNYYPRMLAGDMAPGFYVEHFIKDMKIALDEADRMKLCLPGLAQAKQFYTALSAMGGGRCGTQALIKVFEAMSAGPSVTPS